MLISSHGVIIRVRDMHNCVVASLRLTEGEGAWTQSMEYVIWGDHVCSKSTIYFDSPGIFLSCGLCLFLFVREFGAPY